MNKFIPTDIEVYGHFSRHLGPRFQTAGVSLQLHSNQGSGIVCKVPDAEPLYVAAIIKGVEDGLVARYGSVGIQRTVWITKIDEHPIDSSERAFYLAARGAVDLLYSVTTTASSIQ